MIIVLSYCLKIFGKDKKIQKIGESVYVKFQIRRDDQLYCVFKYLFPFPLWTFHLGPLCRKESTSHPINVRLHHISCYGQWNVKNDISYFQNKIP